MPSHSLIAGHREVQNAARIVLEQLGTHIGPGDSERSIAEKAHALLCAQGYPDTWYYDCPALVLLGSRSCLSISGRDYVSGEERVGLANLITVDLSPRKAEVWGDCARSFFVEGGVVIEPTLDEFVEGKRFLADLHLQMQRFARPDLAFQELFEWANGRIASAGFENLDFLGNVGHSIATRREDRQYIERSNRHKLAEVPFFTFEPHVRTLGGRWGFKHENIFYFDDQGQLQEL